MGLFTNWKAKYQQKRAEARTLEGQLTRMVVAYRNLEREHKLLAQQLSGSGNNEFTNKDIDRLVRLCHPDKHGGKQAAVEMTQKLLKMRG